MALLVILAFFLFASTPVTAMNNAMGTSADASSTSVQNVLRGPAPFFPSIQEGTSGSGPTLQQSLLPEDRSGYSNDTIVRITNPRGVASNPTTGYLYVAGGCNGPCASNTQSFSSPQSALYSVDPSNAIVHTTLIPGPYSAAEVAVDPDTNVVWVLSMIGSAGAQLIPVDGASYIALKNITVSVAPASSGSLAVDSKTDTVYVSISNGYDPVYVVNGETYKVTCITLTSCDTPFPFNGDALQSVAVDPQTNTVYITAYPNTLYIASGQTDRITKTIRLPGTSTPGDLAVDPLSNRVYVADGPDVLVVDGTSGAVLGTISGVYPQHLAVLHDARLNGIYVTSAESSCFGGCFNNTLEVVDGSTDHLNTTIPLGTQTTPSSYVATNAVSNTIYAGCCGGDVLEFVPSPNAGGNQSTLTVFAEDTEGQALNGYAAVLNQSGTTIVAKGYTPANFTLNDRQPYTVDVDNYTQCHFDHWLDNGNSTQIRSISITTNTQITAVMNCATQKTTSITSSLGSSHASSSSSATSSSSGGSNSSSSSSPVGSTSSASSTTSLSSGGTQSDGAPPLGILAAVGIVVAAVFIVGTTLAFWLRRR